MQWQTVILGQIEGNKKTNLLHQTRPYWFSFNPETCKLIESVAAGAFTESETEDLITYTTKATLSSFYRVNQYYQFDVQAEVELQQVYRQLLYEVQAQQGKHIDFDTLADKHFKCLQRWLITNQPDATLLFPSNKQTINKTIICAEYSVATQLTTLGINVDRLQAPILDIGCGHAHKLVNYLQENGFEVYGIDRDVGSHRNVERVSWLDFSFQKRHWGTLISHLGFSNHFRYQHLKQNSDYLAYAVQYMEILQSLQQGGTFYYAPDVPFIEAFLNPQQYCISKNPIEGTHFYAVAIQRLT